MFRLQNSWRAYRQNQSDSFKPLAHLVNSGEIFLSNQNAAYWRTSGVQIRWQPSLSHQLAQFTAMRAVRQAYTALMLLLAKATDRELARMVSYLKEENRVLRARLPERINVTPKERQRSVTSARH